MTKNERNKARSTAVLAMTMIQRAVYATLAAVMVDGDYHGTLLNMASDTGMKVDELRACIFAIAETGAWHAEVYLDNFRVYDPEEIKLAKRRRANRDYYMAHQDTESDEKFTESVKKLSYSDKKFTESVEKLSYSDKKFTESVEKNTENDEEKGKRSKKEKIKVHNNFKNITACARDKACNDNVPFLLRKEDREDRDNMMILLMRTGYQSIESSMSDAALIWLYRWIRERYDADPLNIPPTRLIAVMSEAVRIPEANREESFRKAYAGKWRNLHDATKPIAIRGCEQPKRQYAEHGIIQNGTINSNQFSSMMARWQHAGGHAMVREA